jgi:hypothetical protein
MSETIIQCGSDVSTFHYLSDDPPLLINGLWLVVDGGFPQPEGPTRYQFKPLSPSVSVLPSASHSIPSQDLSLESQVRPLASKPG